MASVLIRSAANGNGYGGAGEGGAVLSLCDQYEAQRPVATAAGLSCAEDMSKLTDLNNLYEAFKRARKGSAWKGQVQKFEVNWLLNICLLKEELESGIYRQKKVEPFTISERGHIRKIVGNSIRDRVVVHSLCDNILQPAVDPFLISDNAASRVGKGITYTRNRLVEHLRSFYSVYGANDGYVLLTDFSKYYDNIDHEKVLSMLTGLIDPESFALVELILKGSEVDVSYMTDEEYAGSRNFKYCALEHMSIDPALLTGEKMLRKSMNIGDQTSQVIGIWYPTRIDTYIKTVRRMRYYGRYMDDLYIIASSKEELWSVFEGIKEQARLFGIFINEKKTRVVKLSQSFRFLQIQYALTEAGRIIQKINPKRLAAMRRRLKKLRKKLDAGIVPFTAIDDMYRSWTGGYMKYMSRLQKENLEKLYNSLYGEERKERDYELQHKAGKRQRAEKRRTQWQQLHHYRERDRECTYSRKPRGGHDLGRPEGRNLWSYGLH